MGTSIKPILWSRKDKNGLYPVKIRVTTDRKSQYFPLKFSVKKSEWSKAKSRVKTTHKNHSKLNNLIEAELHRHQGTEAKPNQRISEDTNVLALIESMIKTQTQGDKLNTPKRFRTLYRHLEAHMGHLDLHFYEVDREFVLEFRSYLETNVTGRGLANRPSKSTVSKYLKTFRTVVNEASNRGLFHHKNPFVQDVIPKIKGSAEKNTLSGAIMYQLGDIHPVDSSRISKGMYDSLNVFLFAFWSQGLRVGDVLQMRYSNLVGNAFVFEMQKTGKKIKIPLTHVNLFRFLPYLPNGPITEYSVFSTPKSQWTPAGESIAMWYGYYLEARAALMTEKKRELEQMWTSVTQSDPRPWRLKKWSVHSSEFQNRFDEVSTKGMNEFIIPDLIKEVAKYEDLILYSAMDLIQDIARDDMLKNTFIFPHLRGLENASQIERSKKISSSTAIINKNLKRIADYLGIPPFTTHMSRHTFTTLAKGAGYDLSDIRIHLGHNSITTTQNYYHSLDPADPEELTKRLQGHITGRPWNQNRPNESPPDSTDK